VASEAPLYLDACATTPLLDAARLAMAAAQQEHWANPSSLHGFGLAAAEGLERSRQRIAQTLGTTAASVHFCSGATESVHLGLLGVAAVLPPARLLISRVEHPAVVAAAEQLQALGWDLQRIPVDGTGLVRLDALEPLLEPPTRLVSMIWGQSEVGTIQPLEAIGALCRRAGVLLHSDAVQLAPHQPIAFDRLPLDLLSLTAHKLGGPRGIGALLVRPGTPIRPLLGGGGQEQGLRAGTEAVPLAAGFAAALEATDGARRSGEAMRLRDCRDQLLEQLIALPGVRLSGADPDGGQRLPHHISLVIAAADGSPLSGRQLVQALWQEGVAASSGSACSAGRRGPAPSPVLLAMGYGSHEAAAGVRLSLGPWLQQQPLQRVPQALARAIARCTH